MARTKGSDCPTHLQVRHARIREAFPAHKIDAIVLNSAADIGYITGHPFDDCTALLSGDRLTLFTDSRYDEEVGNTCPWLDRRIFAGKQTMADVLADALIKSKCARAGFERNFITFGFAKTLETKVKEHKSRGAKPKLTAVDNLTVNVRKTKDGHEIDAIRRAVRCAEEAYKLVRADLRVGMSESDIAGRMEYEMRRHGASASSFGTNVSAGANSSLPHYRPKSARVQTDASLLFDWGAVVDGYCSDITRTHAVGAAPPKLREIYGIVLEAQLSAIAAIKPGAMTNKVDKVARDIISRAGYGKQFGHGLGHGIGLAIHELPRLSKIAKPEPLQPGMVVTVEPGIYLPGIGGVRIEDDVLVTHAGCEVLTSLDKSYEGCHLE